MRRQNIWYFALLGVVACEAFAEPPASIAVPTTGTGGFSSSSTSSCGDYAGPSVSTHAAYQQKLYAWLNDEEVALIVESGVPLLSRGEGPLTPIDHIEHELAQRREEWIPSLGGVYSTEERVEKTALAGGQWVLSTWPVPFAAYRPGSGRDHLLQITLRSEAWLMVHRGQEYSVLDSGNTQIPAGDVLSEPERVAGVMSPFEGLSRQEFESTGVLNPATKFCSSGAGSKVVNLGDRGYFITNPQMIEAWSVDSEESVIELNRNRAELAKYLEDMRTFAEPVLVNLDLPCFWLNYGQASNTSLSACVQRHLSSLNSTDPAYLPSVRNFVELLDALGAIDHGQPLFSGDIGPAMGGASSR